MDSVDRLRAWRLAQRDATKCGSAVALVVRALADPGYAARLAQAPALVAVEQDRIHRATNRFWPRRFGTSPWGLVAELNRGPGAGYQWRVLPRRAGLGAAFDRVLAALDAGNPVPLLLGRAIPRHYVLLVGRTDADVSVYDPWRGEVRAVPLAALRGPDTASMGMPRVFGYALPR